jgi:transcriptional regulator with XRE-family HTH domain
MIALDGGKDTARRTDYDFGMAAKRHRPVISSSVSKNLRMLLDLTMEGNQSELARQSGVSQRHISDIINGRTECTYPISAALAAPFGLTGWHLLLPDLPKDLVASPSIARLVSAYINADDAGREFMDAAAAREAKRKP